MRDDKLLKYYAQKDSMSYTTNTGQYVLICQTCANSEARCLALYNLLYLMAALVLSSLSLVLLYKLQIIE